MSLVPVKPKSQQGILESTLALCDHTCDHEYDEPEEKVERGVDYIGLSELLWHHGARAFETRLGVSISQLYHNLFLQNPHGVDLICFTDPNWKAAQLYHDYGKFFTRQDLSRILFSYVLKRISCLQFIEAEGYKIKEDDHTPTDDAFAFFLSELLKAMAGELEDLPKGYAAMIEEPRAFEAFKVFTEQPMKFKVQMKIGQQTLPAEYAAVWCQDVGEDGGWDLVWEFMSKGLARVIVPDWNYSF